jgi:hypothetical protein
MKRLKLFEDFKLNNEEGELITVDDIIKCIKNNGVIYTSIVKDYPNNNPEEPINPVSIDDDGLITVDIDGSEYNVDLKDVEKIDF